jgi:transposase
MARLKRPDPKREELKRRGTLHPHPERVVDELFVREEFFDARDAVQVKYEMLRRVSAEGRAIARAAADCGFSRPSFYKAQADFRRAGVPGLLPAKKGPRRAHKLAGPVMELIEQELATDPSLGSRELARRVRARFDVRVHARSIERALARRQKKRP